MADIEDTPTPPVIISRAEAKAAGLARYFTGKPCGRGHIAERHTVCRECVPCKVARRDKEDRENKLRTRAAWRVKNREKIRAEGAAYEKTEKRQSAERKAAMAAYRAANKERQKERQAAWRAANAEKVRQNVRAWAQANPDQVRAMKRNRAARKRSAEGRHTAADIKRIYGQQGGKCAYCKQKVGTDYQVDHIQPLARGGSNWPANLQILCPACNGRKHAKDPIEHAQSLGLLL